jgi:hypothetical protein
LPALTDRLICLVQSRMRCSFGAGQSGFIELV